MGDNRIGPAGGSRLVAALGRTRVSSLNLGGNKLEDTPVVELARLLGAGAPITTSLQELRLEGNLVTDAGALALAQVLHGSGRVQLLLRLLLRLLLGWRLR